MLGKPMPMNKPTKLNITKPDFVKPTITKPTDTKPTITKPTMPMYNTTVIFDLLNKTEQLCLDKIFNLTTIKTLKPFEQCGGQGEHTASHGMQPT
jgi:hypothetical protein